LEIGWRLVEKDWLEKIGFKIGWKRLVLRLVGKDWLEIGWKRLVGDWLEKIGWRLGFIFFNIVF